MSFNRLNYDTGAYNKIMNESTGPGIYNIQTPKTSCEPCYPVPPSVRLQKEGGSVDSSRLLVDVGSDLLGLNYKNTKDPTQKYLPMCDKNICNSGEPCGQGVTSNCNANNIKSGERPGDNLTHFRDCFVAAEDTRLSNPSCNLRGTGWNRWEWLCKNPQERVGVPFDYNICNRLVVKDAHRPCIPNPIDINPSLPVSKDLPCEKTNSSCSSFTNPQSVTWQKNCIIRQY
jgi:hypothetical protein